MCPAAVFILTGLAFVISPRESTTRADESNVGEETERGATPIAAPLRWSGGRRPARGTQTTPARQVREAASFSVLPLFFARRSRPHTRTGPVADQTSARSATLAWLPRLFLWRAGTRRRREYEQQQTSWTGRHVGGAASANWPGDLIAQAGKTPTGSKRSNQAPPQVRGLRHFPGCTFSFWRPANQSWRYV